MTVAHLNKCRLVIPIVTIAEALDGPENGARTRAQTLELILRRLERKTIIGLDERRLIEREAKLGHISRTPSIPSKEFVDVRNRIVAYANHSSDEAFPGLASYLMKDISYKLDRRARDDCLLKFPDANGKMINTPLDNQLVELIELTPWFRTFIPRKRVVKVAKSCPKCFPATWILLSYLTLNALGSTFSKTGFGRYGHVLRGPQRGAWVDARTASAGAYSRIFLSDDQNQREKLNFISTRFGQKIKAMSWEEWMADLTRNS